MSRCTNHDKSKTDLSKELETVLKASIASSYSARESIPSEITQNICNVIEAIFIHGLRDPFFLKGSRYAKYPEPNFWPFVSKYSHRSITTQINALNQIKSEIGRGRAWIRIVLNESSLEHYIQLLLSEKRAINQFYHEHAFLRDEEHVDGMRDLLKGLAGLPIQAAINSSFLNAWTPSPLILAGLVAGKPLRVGALTPRHNSSFPCESLEEVDISTLDPLPSTTPLSPIPQKHRSAGGVHMDPHQSDDDASSVYSHPSMLDRTECRDWFLSSTPNVDSPVLQVTSSSPHNIAPLIVSRRAKRPRRWSRSSSESNSKDSRSHSESTSMMAGVITELDITVPDIRLKQSETMDSGIESENRKSISSVSEGKELENWHSSTEAATSDVSCLHTSNGVDNFNTEASFQIYDHLEGEKSCATSVQPELEENLTFGADQFVVEAVLDYILTSVVRECTAEFSTSPVNLTNEISLPLNIKGDNIHHDENDSVFGSSLHDEFIAALEPLPGSNSLVNQGWVASKTNPVRDNLTIISSSSGTDNEGIEVSFNQALRSAMQINEQGPSSVEDSREGSIIADVETDSELSRSRKSSISDEVTRALTVIAREEGLDNQDFRCPMCRKSIGAAFGKYGVCGMDGLCYCQDCMHPGGEECIPARVLLSWDWKQRPVSDRGRAFLEANQEKAVIHIEEHNSTLYDHVPVMKIIKNLREQLQIVSMYLFNCRESIAEDFRRRVWPRDYLYNNIHLYSFADLLSVHNGILEKQLNGLLKYAIDHVMHCSLCRQKGFICEICGLREVIYPFYTDTTHRCTLCYSVFHKECADKMENCPKCARRAQYETRQEADHLSLD